MYSELHCEMRGNLRILNAKQVSEEWALFKFSLLFIVHSILKQSTKLWKQSEHLSKLKAILCSCFYSLLKGLASFYTVSAEPSQDPPTTGQMGVAKQSHHTVASSIHLLPGGRKLLLRSCINMKCVNILSACDISFFKNQVFFRSNKNNSDLPCSVEHLKCHRLKIV